MYLALYRKWRPKLFDDVIAQEHVTVTLKNEIRFNKVAHAYLFTGPRGTGKTSCARIFSKALNCLNNVDGEPCCRCEICKGIEDGTILDVVELDGASSNSVNDVKVLRDEANFVPSYCKFKVYIIDEVHMLSISAFNALLKIMEDPPKYVVFILATTEVSKVLKTVVSRCQRFDFRRVSALDVERSLSRISKQENIILTEEAAKKIATLSDGSLRDAVSFLDECYAVSSTITLDLINRVFGFTEDEQVLSLFEFIVKVQRFEALKLIDEIYENGRDLQGFCSDFVEFCREIVMCAVCKDRVFDFFSERVFNKILMFSKDYNFDFMLDVLNESLVCFENLKLALNKKLRFELFILSLCYKFENYKKNITGDCGNNLNVVSSSPGCGLVSSPSVVNKDILKLTSALSSSELKLELLKDWPEILDNLKIDLKNDMLSGFLVGSKAYVSGDKLYIDFENPIVSRKVLEKSTDIAQLIKQKTGKNYRIFIKKSNVKDEHEKFLNSNLNDFLNTAKSLGIDIDEKK